MGAMDQARSNAVLNALLTSTTLPVSTMPIRCRLMTANGSATANGTELAASAGYTSGAAAPSVTFAAASAGGNATSAALSITNMPAATIPGIELWDSSATPVRQFWGALTASKTTNAGDTFLIPAGSLTTALP